MALWAMDTEDDGKGKVTLVNFYNGKKHYTFRNVEEAVAWLVELPKAQIWCTNLGYDLTNLFYHLPGFIKINYVGSRVISAKVPRSKIYFCDTLNHWKLSVAKMGERIGLKKLEENLFDGRGKKPTMEQFIRRCRRDTEITYRFVLTMRKYYRSIGMKLKPTIGSSVLEHFCESTGFNRKAQYFTQEELTFMEKAVYGGRTEVFNTNLLKGTTYYWDFNSKYPAVNAQNKYPVLSDHYETKTPNFNLEGIVHARVFCPLDLNIPLIPTRTDSNLVFPVGEFDTYCTYPEIRLALELGYQIFEVYRAIEFPSTCYPFKDYIEGLYEKRVAAKKAKDELLVDTYKAAMVNLWGKFNQGNEKTELIPISKKMLEKYRCIILEDKWILRIIKGEFPEHANKVWGAYTTAYGRIDLWWGLIEADQRGELAACDTDSIIGQADHNIFGDSDKLGELKCEGVFNQDVWFKGLKHYRLRTKHRETIRKFANREAKKNEIYTLYRVRGIPRASAPDFFEKKKATFRKPYRLREVLRRNTALQAAKKAGKKIPNDRKLLIPNYWEMFTKEDHKKYTKRRVLPNGKTRPITFRGHRSGSK